MRSASLFALFATVMVPAALGAPARAPLDVDTRNAIPATQARKLPRSEERYRDLQQQIEETKPGVETARQRSATLSAQAATLRRELIETAARVQGLEQEKVRIDSEIGRLSRTEKTLSTRFAQDRVRVAHLLAVLERLQSDLPPAIAFEPADALHATRAAMVLGAALPRVYGEAAALLKQLDVLRRTQASLFVRRQEGARNAAQLTLAQAQLDQLVATKEREATGANAAYQALQANFSAIASEASDLKALIDRVAALRGEASERGTVTVGKAPFAPLRSGSLASPVVGQIAPNLPEDRAPGLSYVTAPGAAVVAPTDSKVLFAGAYHKTGGVLILEVTGGYDLVLAGLDHFDVRPGDQLLAGEPVGRMPLGKRGAKLYFELRRDGKGVSPAPWLAAGLRKAKKT